MKKRENAREVKVNTPISKIGVEDLSSITFPVEFIGEAEGSFFCYSYGFED
jgi:hypothetical protein